MAFILFLLVNAALFVRPGEIVPAMQGWEVYYYVILSCLVLSALAIYRHLTEKSLAVQPITVAVFGLLIAIMIPEALAGDVGELWRKTFYFVKVIAYYMLFVSVVTTSSRLRALLLCIVMCSATVAALAVLRYHGVIHLEAMTTVKESITGTYGNIETFSRLQGTGTFGDPNELCVMIAAMIPACLYFLMTDRSIFLQGMCAAILPLFTYTISLTYSRGGLLAFMGGLGALFWMKYGWKKSAVIGLVGLPILLIAFGGRQTELSASTGTARTRIELWRDWLQTFRESPVVGSGMTLTKDDDKKLASGNDHMAHNSFLQAFADLGLVGGVLFIGAFFTAIWSLYRFRASNCVQLNSDLKDMQPYVLASVVAYAIGMLGLSVSYTIPTFLILALAVAYTRTAQRTCLIAPPPLRVDLGLCGRCLAVGVGFLVSIYIFVRVMA